MQILGYEVDPMSGERITYGAQAGRFIVKRERDIAPALDYTSALRNANEYTKRGIKVGLWHALHIPDTVAAKMLAEDGFDVYRRSAKEIRVFLRQNRAKYANLFTTSGKI